MEDKINWDEWEEIEFHEYDNLEREGTLFFRMNEDDSKYFKRKAKTMFKNASVEVTISKDGFVIEDVGMNQRVIAELRKSAILDAVDEGRRRWPKEWGK